ncbi:YdeI/OmpD-associated family protein [Pseudoclavibacter helvolus]|uniref:YdeI/OmpD-associated family protein n=1 Tax=Pseudoclavibacter helvolus TaxID=255205 RepID=UPI003C70F952
MAEQRSVEAAESEVPDTSAVRFSGAVMGVPVVGDVDGAERRIVRLPDDASRMLPSRGQVAVVGSIRVGSDGEPLPIEAVIEPDGLRGHWLDVGAVLGAHAEIGEHVGVELRPRGDWPEPEVPADFAAALADAPESAETWRDITPMARWEWVRWINATRVVKTRERRIEVGLSKLEAGKRRPCCFDLSSCTDPELSKSGKLAV